MELIIVIAIILVLCLILGVNLNQILMGVTMLVCIFFIFMAIGFIYCAVRLLFCKQKEAYFSRFDNVKNGRVQVAYYLVEGEEYPCVFPKELVMEKKLYSTDKSYTVMLDMKSKKIYDRYAIATCVLGLLFSVGFCIVLVIIFF